MKNTKQPLDELPDFNEIWEIWERSKHMPSNISHGLYCQSDNDMRQEILHARLPAIMRLLKHYHARSQSANAAEEENKESFSGWMKRANPHIDEDSEQYFSMQRTWDYAIDVYRTAGLETLYSGDEKSYAARETIKTLALSEQENKRQKELLQIAREFIQLLLIDGEGDSSAVINFKLEHGINLRDAAKKFIQPNQPEANGDKRGM